MLGSRRLAGDRSPQDFDPAKRGKAARKASGAEAKRELREDAKLLRPTPLRCVTVTTRLAKLS